MMAVVAVLALVLGSGVWLWRRSADFRSRADYHRRMAESTAMRAHLPDPSAPHVYLPTPRSEYHARLMERYERAAARPWESVPPDPPAP
jgi:hypothetical protein